MRLVLLAAAALFATSAAHAQSPLTGTTSSLGSPATPTRPPGVTSAEQVAPPTTARRHRASMQERFDEANTTHDGHLTQEQARSRMPAVARDFAAIDADHKGFVTLDEIRAHTRTQRAARRAARAAQ